MKIAGRYTTLLQASIALALIFSAGALAAQTCAETSKMIIAKKVTLAPDSTFPSSPAWDTAQRVHFCADWQGKNPDPQRQTEVRALWSPSTLYLRFVAHYRDLYTYPGGPQRRNQLWDRDVAEVFLQASDQSDHVYSEIEVSPNGDWIDLAIDNRNGTDLRSEMKSHVTVDAAKKIWTAVVAIPMKSLTPHFDPRQPWRVNFFRIEGPEPNRFYSSWQPTNTPQPNFHVPAAFVPLQFEP